MTRASIRDYIESYRKNNPTSKKTDEEKEKEYIARIDNVIDIIKSRSYGKYRLRQDGNIWMCCPFHTEKHPSFSVNVYDANFKCHSRHCAVHGGLFKLEQLLGVVGQQPLQRRIIKRDIEPPWVPDKNAMRVYRDFVDLASRSFQSELGDHARAYLYQTRKLTDLDAFRKIQLTLGAIPHYGYTKKYFNKRDRTVLQKFGILSEKENDVLARRVLMMHPGGFIQGRSYDPKDKIKFLNSAMLRPVFLPPDSDDWRVIVESPICGVTVMHYGMIPVITYGSLTIEAIKEYLAHANTNGITVINGLDMDAHHEGYTDERNDSYFKELAQLPRLDMTPYKDPNEAHIAGALQQCFNQLSQKIFTSSVHGESSPTPSHVRALID